ncbi:hypothetical protein GCM10009555_046330 [Acrocarpospora macrocephala]|uniref:Thiazolylpeptide-type bacteriocin n=1 Tax=Acrocarpospora macrocephala TaxID=150177 RepID=A0A5M3WTX4_9ACTN|nr:hypothetical protein [Acrocarpospora macrocephala]GES11976.1 hypothetical protein Amac_055730 [Acrocarpospora macrocephala]
MNRTKAELAALETETFEIEVIADMDSTLASVEMPIDPGYSSCTYCSTSCSCWTSTSTSCS